MVSAWYFVNCSEDQRCPHKPADGSTIPADQLVASTGVSCFQVHNNYVVGTGLPADQFCADKGYNYQDTVTISPSTLDNYDHMISKFYEEHLHDDDEVRWVLEGSGFFDVRDSSDRMVRIAVVKDDLIILPAGIYHRFTCDQKNFIKARRFFHGDPVWTPHVRNSVTESRPARLMYLKNMTALYGVY